MVRAQLQAAEPVVSRAIKRPLQGHQRDALLCLVSDLMSGLAQSPSGMAFERSFLVTVVNKGMFQIAAAEFHVFCYADGKVQTRAMGEAQSGAISVLQRPLALRMSTC